MSESINQSSDDFSERNRTGIRRRRGRQEREKGNRGGKKREKGRRGRGRESAIQTPPLDFGETCNVKPQSTGKP